MVDKVFGLDFTNETTPTSTSTISVNNGSALVDVELANIHKALTVASEAEVLTGTETKKAVTPVTLNALLLRIPRSGQMLNGKISVTVSSNDLIMAIKTLAGSDPSASDPVYVNIDGTVRTITAACSLTLADGTNWMNLGSTELATKEADLFFYAVWDSNSSVVACAVSRIPYGKLVSQFSSTTTNEKYLGGYAGFTSTDSLCVIGRFAATLSAGATYTWTVPTFTAENLVQESIFYTRWLDYSPVMTGLAPMTYVAAASVAKYRISQNTCDVWIRASGTTSVSASSALQATLPFDALLATSFPVGYGNVSDGGSVAARVTVSNGTPDLMVCAKYDGTNFSLSTGRVMNGQVMYEI